MAQHGEYPVASDSRIVDAGFAVTAMLTSGRFFLHVKKNGCAPDDCSVWNDLSPQRCLPVHHFVPHVFLRLPPDHRSFLYLFSMAKRLFCLAKDNSAKNNTMSEFEPLVV